MERANEERQGGIRPVRVLHVLGRMDPGGVETWLMHVLRGIDRARFQLDFLVHTKREAFYDREVLSLGGRIFQAEVSPQSASYPFWLHRFLGERPAYDAVHAHPHYYCGIVLGAAWMRSVPVRIAHSHLDSREVDRQAGALRRAYLLAMRASIRRFATVGLFASGSAGEALFGEAYRSDPRWRLHPYGIDLGPFRSRVDRGALRRELGIPEDAFVVGHVGRFVPQKNHTFVVEVTAALAARRPRVHLVLVGDGSLRAATEELVERRGLRSVAHFLGLRDDVARIMMGAMDVLVFPSLFEGLGLVIVEAQAAGLPCVISDGIPEEATVIPDLVARVPLGAGVGAWADAANRVTARLSGADAARAVESSCFNIVNNVEALQDVYLAR